LARLPNSQFGERELRAATEAWWFDAFHVTVANKNYFGHRGPLRMSAAEIHAINEFRCTEIAVQIS
jgi:hypothetical protein